MKLYITGGGTGGHVTPGLAIARYFEKKQPQTTVRFAGSARGIENKLVPREGYPLDTIEIIGMSRSMSPKGILHNLKAAKLAVSAVSKAKKLLKQAKPDCVIGCGGYASFAVVRAAQQLGVKKIVMMSGLPVGCEGDKTPVWITTSWPPETQDILDYQWNQVAIPAWKNLVKLAEDCGIERIALENHGMQLVYNPETLLRLREAVGPMIGMNLDPSHLFWMGGDPIEAARVLGEHGAIYHIHGKDSRPERRYWQPNGMLDTKPIDAFARRSWNYVAVGAGHDAKWWKEFFSVVRMSGYDEEISLEMEDLTLSMLDGHLASLQVLHEALNIN